MTDNFWSGFRTQTSVTTDYQMISVAGPNKFTLNVKDGVLCGGGDLDPEQAARTMLRDMMERFGSGPSAPRHGEGKEEARVSLLRLDFKNNDLPEELWVSIDWTGSRYVRNGYFPSDEIADAFLSALVMEANDSDEAKEWARSLCT